MITTDYSVRFQASRFGFDVLRVAYCVFLLSAAFVAFSAPTKPNFLSFSNILQNNVFNTKRSARNVANPQQTQRVIRTEYVALTGTMKDEKGPLAFFYGSRPDYQKVLKTNDAIAGFTIADIEHAYVKLKSGTNELMLPVNMQLSREEQGEWQLGPRSESSLDFGLPTTASTQSSGEYRRRDRYSRDDRRDRRGGSDSYGSSNRDESGSSPIDVITGTYGLVEPGPAPAVNLNPGAGSNEIDTNSVLEILRRRREQEDGQ